MEYGSIFVDTWRTIWREKRLWLFGLLGYFSGAIGQWLNARPRAGVIPLTREA